ncbi:hypothetical protein EZS27_022345 [termite gut metagenome]|uniref:Uncharacterized protein n=1 Tax=termite gut metagenome TaxID=433724 RepID=A0A5J4R4C5_9ZZZZ
MRISLLTPQSNSPQLLTALMAIMNGSYGSYPVASGYISKVHRIHFKSLFSLGLLSKHNKSMEKISTRTCTSHKNRNKFATFAT